MPPENFVQILERVWWRLDRALDERSLRVSARLYAAESLLYGTTSLVDHQESPAFIEGSLDVLADACQEMGIRAVLCYGATDRNGGREEGRRGLAECRRFLRANQRPLVRGAVGLHASFTCSDETLRESGELARELDTVMHVHMAEDRADVEDARKRGYEGPLERLLATEALPHGSIMAHGVHLEPSQVRMAEAQGLWFVQNPRSNEGNKVGYASSLWASGKVALGTDGWEADMPKEAAALDAAERGRHPRGDRGRGEAAGERPDAGGRAIRRRAGGRRARHRRGDRWARPGRSSAWWWPGRSSWTAASSCTPTSRSCARRRARRRRSSGSAWPRCSPSPSAGTSEPPGDGPGGLARSPGPVRSEIRGAERRDPARRSSARHTREIELVGRLLSRTTRQGQGAADGRGPWRWPRGRGPTPAAGGARRSRWLEDGGDALDSGR